MEKIDEPIKESEQDIVTEIVRLPEGLTTERLYKRGKKIGQGATAIVY